MVFNVSGKAVPVDDDISKMKSLASTRIDEVKVCATVTFCHRQDWVKSEKPSLTEITNKYPKFCNIPQLVSITSKYC